MIHMRGSRRTVLLALVYLVSSVLGIVSAQFTILNPSFEGTPNGNGNVPAPWATNCGVVGLIGQTCTYGGTADAGGSLSASPLPSNGGQMVGFGGSFCASEGIYQALQSPMQPCTTYTFDIDAGQSGIYSQPFMNLYVWGSNAPCSGLSFAPAQLLFTAQVTSTTVMQTIAVTMNPTSTYDYIVFSMTAPTSGTFGYVVLDNIRNITETPGNAPWATATPQPLCAGDAATLTATGGAGNYSWSADATLNTTTGPLVVATPDTTTAYVVVSAGCTDTIAVEVIDCTPLPVTWTGIDAPCNGTDRVITWSVASQQNNDRFEVERSFDLANWEEFATVPGAGTTSQSAEYSVIDTQNELLPATTLVYYRVKQVDTEGAFALSPVAASVCEFIVFPNPAADFLNVASPYSGTTVRLVDPAGRIVREQPALLPVTRFDVRDLSMGIYAVQFLTSGELTGRALVVMQ